MVALESRASELCSNTVCVEINTIRLAAKNILDCLTEIEIQCSSASQRNCDAERISGQHENIKTNQSDLKVLSPDEMAGPLSDMVLV